MRLTLDLKTAVQLLTQGGVFWAKFAHAGTDLNPGQIRSLLAKLDLHLRKAKNPRNAPLDAVTYLRAMIDDSSDARLEQTWREAMVGLDGVQAYQYPWGNKNKTKKLRELAKDARVLHAFQASAVACESISRDVLALLMIDASDASGDALMPHFERALKDPDRLEALEEVQRHESPATAALFSRARGELQQIRAASPVLELGRQFGLAKGDRFKLTVELRATKPVKRNTFDVAMIFFDSNESPGFKLRHGQVTQTPTSHSAWWNDVTSTLPGLAKSLAKVAKKQNVEWSFETAITKPLGRVKATGLLAWLQR